MTFQEIIIHLEESDFYDEGYIIHACNILDIPIPRNLKYNSKNYHDFLEQNDLL